MSFNRYSAGREINRIKLNRLFLPLILIVLMFSTLQNNVTAQHAAIPKAKWQVSVDKQVFKPGDVVTITLTTDLDKGIHIYSSDFDPNCGPLLAELEIEEDPSVTPEGGLVPHGDEKHFDEIFQCEIKQFSNTAKFTQKVKITGASPKLKGTLFYQMCDDESCVSYTYTFDLSVGNQTVPDRRAESKSKYIADAMPLTGLHSAPRVPKPRQKMPDAGIMRRDAAGIIEKQQEAVAGQ